MILIIAVLLCIIAVLLYILFLAGSKITNSSDHLLAFRMMIWDLKRKIPENPEFGRAYWDGYSDALKDVIKNIDESEGNE